MSEHSSDFDDLSEYSYGSAETGGTASIDTVEELLQRFTLECRPDCTLKLRNTVGRVVLGADVTYSTADASSTAMLVVKPSNSSSPWRRLKVDTSGTFTLRSRKLSFWFLTLDLHGHANPFKRTTNVSFRLGTQWDVSSGEVRKKKLLPIGDGAEGRVHWSVNYAMPTVEGNVGNQSVGGIHADYGYAHFSIPKVELVVWPDQMRRASPAGNSVAPAGEGEQEEGGQESSRGGGGGSGMVADVASAAAAPLAAPLARQLQQRGGGSAHPAPFAALSAGLGRHPQWRFGSGSRGSSVLCSERLHPGELRAHIFRLAGDD